MRPIEGLSSAAGRAQGQGEAIVKAIRGHTVVDFMVDDAAGDQRGDAPDLVITVVAPGEKRECVCIGEIRDQRAVVHGIVERVVVAIKITRVAQLVAIQIFLQGIGMARTVVPRVGDGVVVVIGVGIVTDPVVVVIRIRVIAGAVAVRVERLVFVQGEGVFGVGHEITVVIHVAGVTLTVAVGIQLVRIVHCGAIVRDGVCVEGKTGCCPAIGTPGCSRNVLALAVSIRIRILRHVVLLRWVLRRTISDIVLPVTVVIGIAGVTEPIQIKIIGGGGVGSVLASHIGNTAIIRARIAVVTGLGGS